jgi:predicted methyltransferase
MLGLFSKKESKSTTGNRQLVKDYVSVLKDIKKQRAIHCQNRGMSLSDMGKDLAHIERKAKTYYNITVTYLREGKSVDDAYKELQAHHVGTETDRMILDRLLVDKK